MENQDLINTLLSRLSDKIGSKVLLGYVYVNNDDVVQFLSHAVTPAQDPLEAGLETYLVTCNTDTPWTGTYRVFDYDIGYMSALPL